MNTVTKYIERFLCVLTPQAEIKVIQLDEVTAIDGTPVKSDAIAAASVTDPKVAALLAAISAKTHADLEAERAAHAETKKTLATITGERDTLQIQADTIPSLQSEVARLTGELNTATTDLATAESARDAALSQVETLQPLADSVPGLQAEIDRLTALIPPPLPERSIYPRELLGRLTMAEVVAAIRSDDDAVIFAVANLQTTVSPVLLDSEETRLLIGSLVMAGILTPERMAEVLS